MKSIHPLFVHFPIALLLAALAFEVARMIWKRESLRNMSTGALVLGALGALAAMGTGLIASNTVPSLTDTREILETHEGLGIAVACIASALSVIRLIGLDRFKLVNIAFLIIMLVMCGFLAYGAYLGGEMVYKYGLGTALT